MRSSPGCATTATKGERARPTTSPEHPAQPLLPGISGSTRLAECSAAAVLVGWARCDEGRGEERLT